MRTPKTLRGKKQWAHQLLDTAIGALNWNTPHYSSWHKEHYRASLHHWGKTDLSFIGNKVMLYAFQGKNKGYHVVTPQFGAYNTLWSFALECYSYTNPNVDLGPMRPFFLTALFVRRVRERIEKKPPRSMQERVWFYQERAIYRQSLHTLGLDQGHVNDIDTAPVDYQEGLLL